MSDDRYPSRSKLAINNECDELPDQVNHHTYENRQNGVSSYIAMESYTTCSGIVGSSLFVEPEGNYKRQ